MIAKKSKEELMGRVKKDLSGKRFNMLLVLGIHEIDEKKRSRWVCRCDCGEIRSVVGSSLANGTIKSCGCLHQIEIVKRRTRPLEERPLFKVYTHYRTRSKRERGIEFSLSEDEFGDIVSRDCFYCGSKPSNVSRYSYFEAYLPRELSIMYNGVDRFDNSVGYVSGNVVPCCKECNIAKRAMTIEQFSKWVDRISQHKAETDWSLQTSSSEELAIAV